MIRQIILDFDGVILESVSVKNEAFRILFTPERDHVDEIVKFHISNGGMSRFDKFRYIYREILHRELDPATFRSLSEEFSRLVFQGVINSPFVPGAKDFLKKFHAHIPLYIVSATPVQELREIVRVRDISPYFQDVYGAPRKKTDCIQEILTKTGTFPHEALFVGDARNDFAAAQSAGISFIGRVAEGDRNVFAGCTGIKTIITDLNDLSQYLEAQT